MSGSEGLPERLTDQCGSRDGINHDATAALARGVVAIVTGPTGAVCVSASDFLDEGLGAARTIRDAQEYRAKRAAIDDFFHQWCHTDIAKAISYYHRDEIFRKMEGYKLSTVNVGWVDE